MTNQHEPKALTSPFQIKNRTKSDIFIIKPVQTSKNIQYRTQHSPMNQHQKRSQTSLITTTKETPPKNEYRASLTREQLRVVNEDLFDQLVENSISKPLNEAFEPIVKQMFQCEKCVLWIDNPDENFLFSPTFNLKAGYDNTLPGFIFRTKGLIQVRDPSNAPNGFQSDSKLVPPKSPQLFFALTSDDVSRAVVQLIQKPNAPSFSRTDIETANLIISKFSIYGNSIFTFHTITKIAETLYSYSPMPINAMDLIKKHFGSDICEIWQFDTLGNLGQKVIDAYQKDPPINIVNCGIVGDALMNNRSINIPNACDSKSYARKIDGEFPGPVLVVTTEPSRRDSWAIVLRGRKTQFSAAEEVQLRCLLPFVIGSLTGFNSNDERSFLLSQLTELLKTASSLTNQIANANIYKIIQEEATKMLECENCTLFLLSKDKKNLIGYYKSNFGSDTIKRFPIEKGICSHVVETGEIISLLNPSDSNFYDSLIDSANYSVNILSPTSILAAPIFNFNGEIIGCLEMLSKTGTDRFNEKDKKVLIALNVFVGIAIENSRNYRQAADLSKKLRAFVELLIHTNQESELLPLLDEIFDTAKEFIHAHRVTFFISDDSNLSLLLNVGEPAKYGTLFADISKEKKQMTTFSEEEINELTKEQINNQIDSDEQTDLQKQQSKSLPEANFSRISQIFTEINEASISSINNNQVKNESLCCIPLFRSDGSIVGVLETSFSGLFIDEDFELIDSFASIASLSLDRIKPKKKESIEIDEWLTQEEKNQTKTIPSKLFLSDDIFTDSFEIDQYVNEIDLIKIVFKIFDKFELMEKYGITNEILFNFINSSQKSYNKKGPHNWKHAVDTLQFISYQILKCGLDKEFIGNLEQLALFVSSLLHDIDHKWLKEDETIEQDQKEENFEFIFGQISEEDQNSLPTNLLIQKQSLLETHHIEKAIEIINNSDCNILRNLNDSDFNEIWQMIIKLILATDMRKHFKVVQKLKVLLNNDKYDPKTNKKDRLSFMKCLIKAADLSLVVRPFSDSKKDISNFNNDIAYEFFKQGKLKEASGMVFISSDKDFSHLDKDASLLGFFTSVCIPLFQVLSAAEPLLKENLDRLKDNLHEWVSKTGREMSNLNI